MSIEISPELEAALAVQARRVGLTVQAYVESILAKEVRHSGGMTREDVERIVANETPEQRADRAAAVDHIREARKGVTLGPGLTVRDLIDEGRRF